MTNLICPPTHAGHTGQRLSDDKHTKFITIFGYSPFCESDGNRQTTTTKSRQREEERGEDMYGESVECIVESVVKVSRRV